MIEKEVIENLMEDYARFLWGMNFAPTPAQVDKFFSEYGISREVAMEASLHHGVFLAVARIEGPSYEYEKPLFIRLLKWIWR